MVSSGDIRLCLVNFDPHVLPTWVTSDCFLNSVNIYDWNLYFQLLSVIEHYPEFGGFRYHWNILMCVNHQLLMLASLLFLNALCVKIGHWNNGKVEIVLATCYVFLVEEELDSPPECFVISVPWGNSV